MRCLDCGKGKMERRRAKVPHEIRGVRFEVEDTVSVCSHCGSISIPLAHADEHGRLEREAVGRQPLQADDAIEARPGAVWPAF